MTVMLFLEGSIIVSLRQLLDAAEAAQLQAEQGERQAAMALEQQRLFNHMPWNCCYVVIVRNGEVGQSI